MVRCQGMLNDYKHKVALLQEATDKLTSDLAEKDTFISVSLTMMPSFALKNFGGYHKRSINSG